MDSTLDKRIAAMRGSLMDTALEAAESRGQRLAGVAHVLYALYRDDGFTEQVARQAGLEALSCPTVYDSKYMPREGRYECEYVDTKGKVHDLSLLVASGDKVWLYGHNGKPMKVTTK